MAQKKKSSLQDIKRRESLYKGYQTQKKLSLSQKNGVNSSDSQTKGNEAEQKGKSPDSDIEAAIEDALLDLRFYFLESEFRQGIAGWYKKNEAQFKRLGFTPRKFLDYVRDSFDRFKRLYKKMPLEAMNKRSFEYVEKSINELSAAMNDKFGNKG